MAQIFDAIAQQYDSWYTIDIGNLVNKIEKEIVYDLLQARQGLKVLDIGCGTGQYSVELARLGCQVVGIDISEEMLNEARKKAAQENLNIEFISGDIHELELPENTFDLVLSVTALEFFPRPDEVLAKAHYWMKKNGRMVIGVIGGKSPWSDLYTGLAAQESDSVFNYATFYTAQELKELFPKDVKEVRTGLYFPPEFENFDLESAKKMESQGKEKDNPQGAGFVCGLWVKS